MVLLDGVLAIVDMEIGSYCGGSGWQLCLVEKSSVQVCVLYHCFVSVAKIC